MWFVVPVLVACSGGADTHVDVIDSGVPDAFEACPRPRTSPCNPLTQSGCAAAEKCTWIVNAVVPQYIGHVGCVPNGVADVGAPCAFGPPGCDGYDGCKRGLVCSDYRGGAGVCKQICDQQGGQPTCDSAHTCVTYPRLFFTGETTPAAAGVCDRACDPLADNDFDGSGPATEIGSTCGSDAGVGCYGSPSFGTPPKTGWSCMAELHPGASLRHRTQCTELNGCADPGPTIFVNSCSQGYSPLLRVSARVSTAICVALCKPKNCYAGNCGTNDEDRLGEAPHRCTGTDRVGSFETSAGGEHCRFLWYYERDDQGSFLRSPSSDTVGVCVDHAKYGEPPCASLPLTGQPNAVQYGCVDSTAAGL